MRLAHGGDVGVAEAKEGQVGSGLVHGGWMTVRVRRARLHTLHTDF